MEIVMDAKERHRKMRDILEDAHELPAGERKAFVASRCGGDVALLGEIELLMGANITGFLESSPAHQLLQGAAEGEDSYLMDPPPDLIPGFRVLRRLGMGGMGVAFEAEQLNPRRTVALKMIRSDRVGKEWVERFRHESNALGRLQHPNIARIYEASMIRTATGRQVPYIAMEYVVRGMALTTYMCERGLSLGEKVEMMAQLCDAMQHAHQRGIIHRDLKPANILVDGSGRPFILDFGVALIMDDEARLTMSGIGSGPMAGTLQYMSPEQAGGDGKDIDTRSDVYALGALCYEVFAGRYPYDLSEKNLLEAIQIIQGETPLRLGAMEKRLRGDLETITMKALEKDREQRYRSASEMGDDLRRYLKDEPIRGKRPSKVYLMRKFVRRNKAACAAGALAGLFLVGGLAGTLLSLQRVSAERAAAVVERDNAEAAKSFLQSGILTIGPDAYGANAPIGALLQGMQQQIEGGVLARTPMVEADISLSLGVTLIKMGDLPNGEKMMRRALGLLEKENPPRWYWIGNTKQWLANVLRKGRNFGEAIGMFEEGLAAYGKDGSEQAKKAMATLRVDYAWTLEEAGEHGRAMDISLECVKADEELFGLTDVETVKAIEAVGSFYFDAGKMEEAQEQFKLAAERLKQSNRVDAGEEIRLMIDIANIYEKTGRFKEEDGLLQQAYVQEKNLMGDATDEQMGEILTRLCRAKLNEGEWEAAREAGKRALVIFASVYGEDSAMAARVYRDLGFADEKLGNVDEAKREEQKSQQIYESVKRTQMNAGG